MVHILKKLSLLVLLLLSPSVALAQSIDLPTQTKGVLQATRIGNYGVGVGTAQAQTTTINSNIAAYTDGLTVCWLPGISNTGPGTTLAVNGLSALPILKSNYGNPGSFGAIAQGDIQLDSLTCAVYTSTFTSWVLIGPPANLPCIDVSNALSLTDAGAAISQAFSVANLAYPLLGCVDASKLGQIGTGRVTVSTNPYASLLSGTTWPNYSTDLRIAGVGLDLKCELVIPQKSRIIGSNSVSGQNNNSEIFADSAFVTQAQGCTISLSGSAPNQTATVGSCSSFSSIGGTANTFSPTIYPGAFVLVEKTGSVIPVAFGTDTFLSAWEVLSAGSTSFTFKYPGSLTPSGTYNITIPLVWEGSQTQTSGGTESGVVLQDLAIGCADSPNSVGAFSTTINEGSRHENTWIRDCTRKGRWVQATSNGSPQNFGPDFINNIYISNSAPTSSPGAVGYEVDLNGTPFGGLTRTTIRPPSTANAFADGVQFSGVNGTVFSQIHCEIIDHCFHSTNPSGGSQINRNVIMMGTSIGPGTYPYSGSGTDDCNFTYSSHGSPAAGLYGAVFKVDATSASTYQLIGSNNGGTKCAVDDAVTGLSVANSTQIADSVLDVYKWTTGNGACTIGTSTLSCIVFSASLTTTSGSSDNVAIPGVTASSHCQISPTNASAATNYTTTYISSTTTNQVTVTHTATASMTYSISCTAN